MNQFLLDPDEVARRADLAERRAEEEFKRAGFGWEPLDVEKSRSRPESCILDAPDGKRLCLVETKRVESGGVGVPVEGASAPAMLSDLDPRLSDGQVRRFPGIPPAVRRDLNHARKKYYALVSDRPEFDGLPYIVVFAKGVHVGLDLVDRRMPEHREISGLLLVPPEGEVEWRLVPNPYALRPIPAAVRDKWLVGWPDNLPWPDHFTSAMEEAARRDLDALTQNERVVLEAVYAQFGRIDVARSEHAAAQPILELLVGRGLAVHETDTGYVLTTGGLTLGLVGDLDRRVADDK